MRGRQPNLGWSPRSQRTQLPKVRSVLQTSPRYDSRMRQYWLPHGHGLVTSSICLHSLVVMPRRPRSITQYAAQRGQAKGLQQGSGREECGVVVLWEPLRKQLWVSAVLPCAAGKAWVHQCSLVTVKPRLTPGTTWPAFSQSKIQVGKGLKKSVAPCQILLDLPLSPHKAQTVILSNCYLCLLSHKAAAARCRYIHFMISLLKDDSRALYFCLQHI
jgi:hypothetical protein